MTSILRYILGNKGENGFGSSTSAGEVTNIFSESIHGKVFAITGANSGIGRETAKALAYHGCKVLLLCRRKIDSEKIAVELKCEKCPTDFVPLECDLSSFQSIRKCANDILELDIPINALICNAAVAGTPCTLTEDGNELQFGVNHLGHFLLVNLLLEKLMKSIPSRVIVVCSSGFKLVKIKDKKELFAKPNSICKEKRGGTAAYNFSKLCNMLFVDELDRRMKEQGVPLRVYAVNPGLTFTGIARNSSMMKYTMYAGWLIAKSPAQGASTSTFCAVSHTLENDESSGKYYVDCNISDSTHDASGKPEYGAELWRISEELCGLVENSRENFEEIDQE